MRKYQALGLNVNAVGQSGTDMLDQDEEERVNKLVSELYAKRAQDQLGNFAEEMHNSDISGNPAMRQPEKDYSNPPQFQTWKQLNNFLKKETAAQDDNIVQELFELLGSKLGLQAEPSDEKLDPPLD